MPQNKYQELVSLKRKKALEFKSGSSACLLCPDMGGRVFAECHGMTPHRIDLDCAARPSSSFNNYGGNNFWPAPEGGQFGFNYRDNEWYVQPAINEQPFLVIRRDQCSAVINKEVNLANRAGTTVHTLMQREFRLLDKPPELLRKWPLKEFLSYSTIDSFKIHDTVSPEQALIAAWTLEQFEASDETLSFCVAPNPKTTINFDFYEHPGDKIEYYEKGFTYLTDASRKGQIGIEVAAAAKFIGFIDRSRNLICLRENCGPQDGTFFNIADNDQPQGPFSAADNYSIFNSDKTMMAFELETIGAASMRANRLKNPELVSATSFAVFNSSAPLDEFLQEHLGPQT